MKKETQPQHTQGELRIEETIHGISIYAKDGVIPFCNLPFQGRSKDVVRANAQRIVKAVNMRDDMVEHIRKLNDEFVYALTNMAKILKMNMSVESLRIEENALVKKSKQLLKQSE